jgi:hypothetical protein
MQTARELAVGLLAPIYGQIDPINLGELGRAMKIAEHYGERLSAKSANLKPNALQRLVATYPSHFVVIDREEADSLFKNLREPSPEEVALLELLGQFTWLPESKKEKPPSILLLSTSETKAGSENEDDNGRGNLEPTAGEVKETPGAPGERLPPASRVGSSGTDKSRGRRRKGIAQAIPNSN